MHRSIALAIPFLLAVVPTHFAEAMPTAETGRVVSTPLVLVVNSVGDDVDAMADGVCNTGAMIGDAAECTLRAAIQEANANGGLDRIEFDIAGCPDEICVITIGPGESIFSALPEIESPVVIDGSTQPGNADVCAQDIPDRPAYKIVIDGDGVDLAAVWLRGAGSSGSTIRGLNIRNVTDNLVWITESNDNRIECNFLGPDETGMESMAEFFIYGVQITCASDGNIVGGPARADGNLIAGDSIGSAIQIAEGGLCSGPELSIPTNNAILGNFIGVARDGVTKMTPLFSAIALLGAHNNFIGVLQDGTTVRGNVMSWGLSSGITLDDNLAQEGIGSNSNVIRGNFFGTDRSGTVDFGNVLSGVEIGKGSDNVVGGLRASDANTIAFNFRGVTILENGGTGNRIVGNRMYENIGQGIDLVDAGDTGDATPNDPGDVDEGANRLQNWPEIESAVETGDPLTIRYLIDYNTAINLADSPIRVHFYVADSRQANSVDLLQDGKRYIGFHDYAAPGSADAVLPARRVKLGERILATATDADGNTSEFSPSIAVEFQQRLFLDDFE